MPRRAACIVRPMSDQEWQDCSSSYHMLRHLERSCHSISRLRLAAFACCRLVWSQIPDRQSRRTVRIAEWQAGGEASREEIAYALEGAKQAAESAETRPAHEAAQAALRTLAGPPFADVARHVAWLAAWGHTLAVPGPGHWEEVWADSYKAAEERLCSLIRRRFPSPSPLPTRPAWLAWEDGPVLGLGRTIMEGRVDLLPILADALEEAGCENEEVLAHFRQVANHAEACWLVQLAMGKSP